MQPQHSGNGFAPGTRVLYCRHGTPEPGTVGQVLGGGAYKVALRDAIVEADAGQLALWAAEGQQVMYCPAGAQAVPAVMRGMDETGWPPTYLLQRNDTGEEVVAGPQELAASPVGAPPPPPPSAYPQPAYQPSAPPPQPQAPRAVAATSSAPPPPQGAYPSVHQYAPPPPPAASAPPATAAAPYSMPPAPLPVTATPGYKPSLAAVTEAQKNARYAVSALNHEDIATAVKNLTAALNLLTNASAAPPQPAGRR